MQNNVYMLFEFKNEDLLKKVNTKILNKIQINKTTLEETVPIAKKCLGYDNKLFCVVNSFEKPQDGQCFIFDENVHVNFMNENWKKYHTGKTYTMNQIQVDVLNHFIKYKNINKEKSNKYILLQLYLGQIYHNYSIMWNNLF